MVLPLMDQANSFKKRLSLCWRAHGGSGLGITFGDIDDMTVDEFEMALDVVREFRELESRAIKKG